MNFIKNLTGNLVFLIVILPFLIWIGVGTYNMAMMFQYMDDIEFLSTKEFSIPVGQIVSYMFFSTICFLLKRYKAGLMISYAYVFYWGFLHASANFVDEVGNPTLGVMVYLASGLMMAVLVVVGFFRDESIQEE